MTFEAPNVFNDNERHFPPVVHEVDPVTLQGAELEAAFKAGAVEEGELTSKQRLELHNRGYRVTLPEGEVTIQTNGEPLN